MPITMTPSAADARVSLVRMLAAHSARRGSFTLSSGRTSELYIDARLTTMRPEGLVLIGNLALQTFRDLDWHVDAVGGLTLGADPIAYAISYASALAGDPIRAFSVRKEVKQHGTGKRVEGPFQSGDRVVVIEDVITTGQSATAAIAAVRGEGGHVVGVLGLVDREEGGREALLTLGAPVHCLTRASDIIAELR
jgi:orotate phosphoribosyltransferase